MFAAVLDTSVLWPSLQRDFLLSLAIEGMYRPLWSSAILAELEYTETQKLIDRREQPYVAAMRARHLIDQMTAAFDDALVENWEPHEGTFGLLDPNDEHVVAAAVVGGAGAIVTGNLKDFPRARIPPHIKLLSPAEFAADTVAVSPDVALRAVCVESAPSVALATVVHSGEWKLARSALSSAQPQMKKRPGCSLPAGSFLFGRG